MKTTLAVDVRHTVGKKGAKAASAGSWIVGRHAIQDHAERIVAHDAGTKLMEFVSKSGGFINSRVENGKRIFDVDDMVEATKAEWPDDMTPLVGTGRSSRVRWLD